MKKKSSFVEPIKDMKQVKEFKDYVYKHYNYKHYAFVVLGFNCAMRVGDLIALEWSQVLNNEDIFSEYIKSLGEEKTNKNRRVMLNRTVFGVLKHLRELYPDDIYLFQSESPRIRRAVRPWAKQYPIQFLKKSGREIGLTINIGTHSLRKTFAYHAIVTRRIVFTKVQVLLNHSSPATTLRYVALGSEDIDNVYLENEL